ncbi:hypothetical protein FZEAL_7781 [Fusarium zealandicum]|uniref:Uncharacterized protein n=1 Tax=Fusarium zealandicum TaxID=1053134 RepID=A0A8H4UFT3_9HYPO|nr:hypothetical protein FZEAL_7781 [Fusarium zealandicum]
MFPQDELDETLDRSVPVDVSIGPSVEMTDGPGGIKGVVMIENVKEDVGGIRDTVGAVVDSEVGESSSVQVDQSNKELDCDRDEEDKLWLSLETFNREDVNVGNTVGIEPLVMSVKVPVGGIPPGKTVTTEPPAIVVTVKDPEAPRDVVLTGRALELNRASDAVCVTLAETTGPDWSKLLLALEVDVEMMDEFVMNEVSVGADTPPVAWRVLEIVAVDEITETTVDLV